MERVTLGIVLRSVEWVGARKRYQYKGQGKQNRTDDKGMVLEGSCHRGGDQDGVAEHPDGEVGGTGDGTLGAPSE